MFNVPTDYVTKSLMMIRDYGFNHIRVPYYWEAYVIDPDAFLQEAEFIAKTADENGLYIIWDFHHWFTSSYFGGDYAGFPSFILSNYPVTGTKYSNYKTDAGAFWNDYWNNSITVGGKRVWDLQLDVIDALIQRVDSYDSTLGYEYLNEPHIFNEGQYPKIGNYNNYMGDKMRMKTDKFLLFDRETTHGFPRGIIREPEVVPDNVTNFVYGPHIYAVPNPGSLAESRTETFKEWVAEWGVPGYIGEFAASTEAEMKIFVDKWEEIGFGWAYWRWGGFGVNTHRQLINTVGNDIRPTVYLEWLSNALPNELPNSPPRADAGSDKFVMEGGLVTLDGTGSSDPDGDTLTYSWTQTAGTNVILSDPTITNPTFVAPTTEGIMLGFSLVVNDGMDPSPPDNVEVTIISGLGFEPSFLATGTNYLNEPDRPDLRLQEFSLASWFRTSHNSTGANAMIVNKGGLGSGADMNYGLFLNWGERLKAGFESTDGKNYLVTSPDSYIDGNPHYAVATYDLSILKLYVDGSIVATLSTSAIPDDGSSLPVRVGANSFAENEFFIGSIDEVRIWNRPLTDQEVSDQYNSAIFNTAGQVLYLDMSELSTNNPPSANAGLDRAVLEETVVILNGAATDPDGDPITYSWSQTAGPQVTLSGATTPNPTFTAPSVSSTEILTFQLLVNDGIEDSNIATVDVIVNGSNIPPVADAGPDRTVEEGDRVTLDGTGSFDPDGDPITYLWTQTAGPHVTLSSADIANPTFRAPDDEGVKVTFQLTVSHGVLTDSAHVTIKIYPTNDSPFLPVQAPQL